MSIISSPKNNYSEINAENVMNAEEEIVRWRAEELGVVDTIYEDHEEAAHPCGENINSFGVYGNLAFPKDCAWIVLDNGARSSDSLNILQRSVWSWCEATGFPASVTVRVKGCNFKLHKFPLVSRSGYFKRELMEANEINLPQTFPGGPEILELVAAYCYGSTILMDPSNIAALRCAAEFLEMTEEYCRGNLCKRSEQYFKQDILKNWEDAIEVLRNCKNLHPLAEEMLIVNSCVEAVSLMPIMERFEAKFQFNEGTDEMPEDWWINDLLTLPFDYFGQIIACMRKQGMREKFIGRAMLLYVDRWILDMLTASESRSNFQDKSFDFQEIQAFSRLERRGVIESIVSLLPADKDVMPVSFLFAILRCALAWNASLECRAQLEIRIAAQLEQATVTDFLLPLKTDEELFASRSEIDSMRQIVSQFISQQADVREESSDTLFSEGNIISQSSCDNPSVFTVAKVWDEYLAEIAFDPRLSPSTFLNLVETVPSSARPSHDRLYKAIHIYLKTHPQISDQQKHKVCKILNCQKLSKEVCVHAVQNDLLPLRMIVQAMFMHQLQAANNFQSNNMNRAEKILAAKTRCKGIEFGRRNENSGLSLGCILKRDEAFRQATHLKADFDETSSKLRNLEEEIARMRISFQASLQKFNYDSEDVQIPPRNDLEKTIKVKDITECPEEESSEVAHGASGICLKQPRLASKGCGSGVASQFVKSLQKLHLKKGKQTNGDENGQGHNNEEFRRDSYKKSKESSRHRRNRSESQDFSVSTDSTGLKFKESKGTIISGSKNVRRRHRRNHSVS